MTLTSVTFCRIIGCSCFFLQFAQKLKLQHQKFKISNYERFPLSHYTTRALKGTSKQTPIVMSLTNRALRNFSQVATIATRPCRATQTIVQGTEILTRIQPYQQTSRNYSAPIAIENSDNQDIANLLLMLSPSPPVNPDPLQEKETTPSRIKADNKNVGDESETGDSSISQRREDKKKELSQFLL